METIIKNVLGDTGWDLFHLNEPRRSQRDKDQDKGGDLIYRMAMETNYDIRNSKERRSRPSQLNRRRENNGN